MPEGNDRYAGLYEPLPDRDAYLKRIHYTGSVQPTLAVLNGLMHAQLTSVPFENLEVCLAGKVPALTTAALYDKIVVRHRGGYCFEQNSIFSKLLEALGFSVYAVGVRIHLGPAQEIPPVAHRGNIVTLAGRRYYCDVGFGGPGPVTAIDLEQQTWQQSGRRWFRAEKDGRLYRIYLREEDQAGLLFSFDEYPWYEVDFIGPNLSMSALPDAPFRQGPMVSLLTERGHVSIDGDIYKERIDGKTRETRIRDEGQRREILRNIFSIVLQEESPSDINERNL